jgi:uncharacterized protein (DUF433 family)
MSQTRKQWRKKQKDIKRKKRLETRRQHQQQKKENIISQALGITAAQGYNKNILSQTLALSKTMQSNYLTGLAREKRVRNSIQRFLKDYTEERFTTPLHYAIFRIDPVAIRLLLEFGEMKNLAKKNTFDHTPLEEVLNLIKTGLEERERGDPYHPKQILLDIQKKKEEQKKLITIAELLIDAGAPITVDELAGFWQTGVFVEQFLEKYPQLVSESYTNRDEILRILKYEVKEIVDEMRSSEENNYGSFDPRLTDQYDAREYSLETFKQFTRTYNPQTGAYNLSNSANLDENE